MLNSTILLGHCYPGFFTKQKCFNNSNMAVFYELLWNLFGKNIRGYVVSERFT